MSQIFVPVKYLDNIVLYTTKLGIHKIWYRIYSKNTDQNKFF